MSYPVSGEYRERREFDISDTPSGGQETEQGNQDVAQEDKHYNGLGVAVKEIVGFHGTAFQIVPGGRAC